jgi:WYL domain
LAVADLPFAHAVDLVTGEEQTLDAVAVFVRGGDSCVELAEVWDNLRRRIDDLPAPLAVTVSVRREVLAKFLRIHEADLAGPQADGQLPEVGGDADTVTVELRFRALITAEALLAFGPDVEVLAPDGLRQALARKAAETAALYTTAETRDGA